MAHGLTRGQVIVCLSGLLASMAEAIRKGIGDDLGKVFHTFTATAPYPQASLVPAWGDWVKWVENEQFTD